MLQGQKNIQQSLQKLMKEMQQSSNKHGQGDLKGISQDIEDVISDLSKSNYTRNTKINNVEFYQECLIVKLLYLNEGIKRKKVILEQ